MTFVEYITPPWLETSTTYTTTANAPCNCGTAEMCNHDWRTVVPVAELPRLRIPEYLRCDWIPQPDEEALAVASREVRPVRRVSFAVAHRSRQRRLYLKMREPVAA